MTCAKPESLGRTLRRQRRRLGLAQTDLAAKAGISKPYLSLIENDIYQGRVSDAMAAKLAATLEIEPTAFRARIMADGLAKVIPPELWPALRECLDGMIGGAA